MYAAYQQHARHKPSCVTTMTDLSAFTRPTRACLYACQKDLRNNSVCRAQAGGAAIGLQGSLDWKFAKRSSARVVAKVGRFGLVVELGASQQLSEFSTAGLSVITGLQVAIRTHVTSVVSLCKIGKIVSQRLNSIGTFHKMFRRQATVPGPALLLVQPARNRKIASVDEDV